MTKYQSSQYVTILSEKQKGFDGKMFRMGKCNICGNKIKLAGIGAHLHYKHGVERYASNTEEAEG